MSQCIFKRLFEVRLLHDYFLNTENESFFAGTLSDVEREERLRELISVGQLDMREELLIRPTEKTKQHLRNYRLRFIQTVTGFFIGIQVKKIESGNGVVTYEPFIPIDNNLEFTFHTYPVNPRFKSYSNVPLRKRIQAIYHFDNRMSAGKIAPTLSLPTLPFDSNTFYEMGEMAVNGGAIQGVVEDYNPLNPPAVWENVDGQGLVNTNDRRLLPKKFSVKIPGADNLTQAIAVLKDLGGNILNQRTFDISGNITLISLDLEKDDNGNEIEIADGTYTLEITDDQGGILSKEVLLDEELYDRNAFAALTIDTGETDAGFKILEADGTLVHKIDTGVVTPPPLFELRMTSRRCFWRYKSSEDFDPAVVAIVNAALTQSSGVNNMLSTIDPQNLTRIPVSIGMLTLPNPVENAPLRYENGRYYADVYISAVNKLVNS